MLHARIIALMLFWSIVPLRAQMGFVDLRSQPSGAQVFIGDSLRGVTPLFATLPVGTHRVLFRSGNGGTAVLQIEVLENEVTNHEVVIAPRRNLPAAPNDAANAGFGKITVVTDVAGAEIAIDRRPTGAVSPVTIDQVPAGRHIVRATVFLEKLQDRFSVAETLQVFSGRTSLVRIDFDANTTEGTLRVESNDPLIALSLRHIDSGKRYSVRRTGDLRTVTGQYELESGQDSTGLPLTTVPVRVTQDSVTILFVPRYARLIPLKRLEDHPSYVDVETFLKRSYKPRPLSDTRSNVYVSQNFAWWLGGGVAMILAAEILQSEETIRRSTNSGSVGLDNRESFGILRFAGVASLIGGVLATSRIDTVQVDLSFNQQANKKDEEFLRARYVDLVATWQGQIDQQNKVSAGENLRRTAANEALPMPTVRIAAPERK